jgi:hypothetical protein
MFVWNYGADHAEKHRVGFGVILAAYHQMPSTSGLPYVPIPMPSVSAPQQEGLRRRSSVIGLLAGVVTPGVRRNRPLKQRVKYRVIDGL